MADLNGEGMGMAAAGVFNANDNIATTKPSLAERGSWCSGAALSPSLPTKEGYKKNAKMNGANSIETGVVSLVGLH